MRKIFFPSCVLQLNTGNCTYKRQIDKRKPARLCICTQRNETLGSSPRLEACTPPHTKQRKRSWGRLAEGSQFWQAEGGNAQSTVLAVWKGVPQVFKFFSCNSCPPLQVEISLRNGNGNFLYKRGTFLGNFLVNSCLCVWWVHSKLPRAF